MDNLRKSFILYTSFYKPIANLSDAQLGRLLRAIFEYQLGDNPAVGQDIAMAFEFIKAQFEADDQKYQRKVETNRENGRRGGAPRGNKNARRIAGQDGDGDMGSEETTEWLKNNPKQPKTTENKRNNPKQHDNDDEDEDDDDTQCVCVDSAQERAESTTTPHTGFDFFFPTFWRRNIIAPASETQRFIDHYEPAGWRLEKGDYLATDAARLAKARNWKPETPGKRFPDGFIQAWEKLSQKAPEALRLQMYDDRVAVKTSGQDVSALVCASEVKAWIMGTGGQAAKAILIDGWLAGNGGKTLRILTYRK